MVLTGYGLNCDNETDFSLHLAGADSRRIHINQLISDAQSGSGKALEDCQILVFGGGFSWADDHGAGVLMASKMKRHLGQQLKAYVDAGNLILGICNGFQALVNLGLLPGFGGRYQERQVALTHNDSGNFIDAWVHLKVNPQSPNVFTQGLTHVEFPVRHGEENFTQPKRPFKGFFKTTRLFYSTLTGMETRRVANIHQTPMGLWPILPAFAIQPVVSLDSCRTRKRLTISPIIRTGPGKSRPLHVRVKALNRKKAGELPSFGMRWNISGAGYKGLGVRF